MYNCESCVLKFGSSKESGCYYFSSFFYIRIVVVIHVSKFLQFARYNSSFVYIIYMNKVFNNISLSRFLYYLFYYPNIYEFIKEILS